MSQRNRSGFLSWRKGLTLLAALLLAVVLVQGQALAFTVQVVEPDGTPVTGFRWMVEEDTTNWTEPGVSRINPPSIDLDIHSSYAPVVAKGNENGTSASVTEDVNGASIDASKRYFVSVLPYDGYANSGAPVAPNQTSVTVIVNPLPLPTAQISILAFVDHDKIDNIFTEPEQGLGGCTVHLYDFSGGHLLWDAFGNPLGTIYDDGTTDPTCGDPATFDPENCVVTLGDAGAITTLTYEDFCHAQGYEVAPPPAPGVEPNPNPCATTMTLTPDPTLNPFNLQPGEARIKNLSPGKYGAILTPPPADDDGNAMTWVQTATIEGTVTIDSWVQENEAPIFTEGFGQGVQHAIFGFVKTAPQAQSEFRGQTIRGLPWLDPTHPEYVDRSAYAGNTITGTLRLNHFDRPPLTQGFYPGAPVTEGWVGLNDPTATPEVTQGGVYAAAADPDTGYFEIHNVPPGTWELVSWDAPLLNLFNFNTVTMPATGGTVNLGDVLILHWFGDYSGSVFLDTDEDGFPDPGEVGLNDVTVNIRFRDGTVYQTTVTDPNGEFQFAEVFPFFKWLVPEVDYARMKPTGATSVVDFGGEVTPDLGWAWPSRGKLRPQPQCSPGAVPRTQPPVPYPDNCPPGSSPVVNPNTGNNFSKTETGPVLLEAMHLFLNQFNEINWGKNIYAPGENGGIVGITFYSPTRAENDPAFAVGEPWEAGIPRTQVNLYEDFNNNGVIDPQPGNTSGVSRADVDNYPFGWQDGGAMGPEDVDYDSNGVFDMHDAVQVTHTDSWDDNKPTGCIQTLPVIHGITAPECADAYATWNQIRPGVFDGGYAFGPAAGDPSLPAGTYIVESTTPPGYTLLKEEDKNVDFGNSYVPSQQLLPPTCVGDMHHVPDLGLSFQLLDPLNELPGVTPDPTLSVYAGQDRPLCDRKQVTVTDGANVNCDFFFFTETPKAARVVGFALNDLTAEFNVLSPNFGEKAGVAWIPVSFKDWFGNELTRVYTDEFGTYNAMLPGSYTANVPAPAGFSPNMLTLVLNDPRLPDGTQDAFYSPSFTVTPWTLNYFSATTLYSDTPIVPTAAFAAGGGAVDTAQVDTGPVIATVTGPESAAGPLLCDNRASGSQITITSLGDSVTIPNPLYNPAAEVPTPIFVTRDFSFGATPGTVTIDGVPLIIDSWTQDPTSGVTTIVATVPGTVTTSGTIVVTRSNGISTDVGVTLNIVDCGATAIREVPAAYPTIQAAIDAADPGDVILVAPGIYQELVIMNKPVHLQGSGAGSTLIDANPNPLSKLQAWHDRINALNGDAYEAYLLKLPFQAGEAPGIVVLGELTFPNGTVAAELPGTTTLNPGFPFDTPGQASIDGFKISGSVVGGGIFAVAGVNDLLISNNEVTNNQGNVAGGIAVGLDDVGFLQNNHNIVIRANKIHKNGGVQGPGGIAMNEDSSDYLIEDNLIAGNFSTFLGAGIGHQGLSGGVNTIRHNQILFNENYHNALLQLAGDGGGIYVGADQGGVTGTGNVIIDGNLIQGNLSGSGRGAGIMANEVNNQDVVDNPTDPSQWYELRIVNNMIVDNVAAYGGGGIFLQDSVRTNIINNTIANNDSTSTSQLAFPAGSLNSTPLPAGIAANVNSAGLQAIALLGADSFSDPTLVNNIVWHNRSYFNDASLNGGVGGLAANPAGLYQDLGVINTLSLQFLNPLDCVLTSTAGYDASNQATDPLFVLEYTNTLSIATVTDEGGNSINVTYPELTVSLGNYHIDTGSPAIDAGRFVSTATYPQIAMDYDGEPRPMGVQMDIGADEFTAAVPSPIFEVGTVSLNHNWTTVNLTTTFSNPVVVAKPLSLNGSDPSVVRIRNVTGSSFDIRLQEWDYLDGFHTLETVSYLVVESGHHTLFTGQQVEAGIINTNRSNANGLLQPVNFSSAFPTAPIVATSVMSFNGGSAVTTRNRTVSTTGFLTVMQEEEAGDQLHNFEDLGYVAWEAGSGSSYGYNFEVGLGGGATHNWHVVNYGPFAASPAVVMDMQTTNGTDTANLRYRNKGIASVQVQVDEEQSQNNETNHGTESIGYFVFGN
ncbi:MAG TPA: SdrD B-like domain-containing protein [Geothermobacteraceae bacterium]|nr:SdrD B-like domain-containing protein [Geothermobacteraceae bacterium]